MDERDPLSIACSDMAGLIDVRHAADGAALHVSEKTLEATLTRADEFGRLVALAAADARRSRAALTPLAAHGDAESALSQTFASLDAAAEATERAVAAVDALEARVVRAERDATARALAPRSVLSARHRATALARGVGGGARDAHGELLAPTQLLAAPAPQN
eukprot:TRINITY_DN5482_c0_g1_i1.p1 TRINITY_DN5482_c0_g1~~TRINITY_DN5482_c0_g1_i1.p1  ORF type:complete len:162 (+),score=58.72 TRINITY_DN5482_c0_g1_i1:73-558(+)